MFIEFNFGNFRSFKDPQKFSLEASSLRANDGGLEEENVFEKDSLRLLKSKAIFGGNASGKSNLATAISAFTYMVSRSVANEGIPAQIWDDRFQLADNEWDEQPVFFQYSFLHQSIVYRYGFQIFEDKVYFEWLFSGNSEKDQIEYFMRTPNGVKVNEDILSHSDPFVSQAIEGNTELYRPDSLFLTAGALSGNLLFSGLRNEIRKIISADGAYDDNAISAAMRKLVKGNEKEKEALKELMIAADTGVEGLEIGELPDHLVDKELHKDMNNNISEGKKGKAVSLFSLHSRYNEKGEFINKISVPFGEWESQGTAKIFSLGSLILDALATGRIMLVDEFDARLHPNLTLKIVQIFNSELTNPLHAQLIFVTHDASLLRRAKLRRDQICMVDKNRFGISSTTSLIEFKGVRKDASYDKEYLQGSYSAVPFLDKMDWVVKENQLNYGD
ncbi:AAA family ATPase [Pedobacter alpinus]|uniref:ATP/GTP-binding protein n=1 Tax=Pedobacter alpinus TaxID=1590643 RepID=A0ABW5TX19_9SPHI